MGHQGGNSTTTGQIQQLPWPDRKSALARGLVRPSINAARRHVVVTCVCLALVCIPRSVSGQDRDAGKEVVKGLLRALVESQLERERGRNDLRPGNGAPPGQVTAEMSRLRPVVAGFSQETATLTALLNSDARRSFEVRAGLAEALRLQAAVGALKQQTDNERDHRVVLPAFASLNAEWKTLSHQLQSMSGISTQTRQCLSRLDTLDAQYCQILGIQEQFDGRDLVRAADALAAEYRLMADEISYAPNASGQRSRLVDNLRRLQDRSQLLANMASDRVPFRTVASEYQSLYQAWQQVRPELSSYNGRAVARSVARIQEAHRAIHELLRLDFGFDQGQVQQLAGNLQREVSDLFRSITLEQMMVLRDHKAIVTAADALAGSAENLTDVVVRQESQAAVGEAWLYLDEAFRLFALYVAPIQVPETRRRLDGVAQSLETLRLSIGVSVAFDQRAVYQQAAILHSQADRIQDSVRLWQARPVKPDRAIVQETDLLETRCRELEGLCSSSRQLVMARSRCHDVMLQWQSLRPRLLECRTEERASLESLADSFTAELVRLTTMLGE